MVFGYDVDDKGVAQYRYQEGEQHGAGENHFCREAELWKIIEAIEICLEMSTIHLF